jgi:hypothetical protein
MTATKTGRNDPCHCGSGLKYKKCHANADDAARSAELSAQAEARAKTAAAAAAAAEEAGEEQPAPVKGSKAQSPQHGGAPQARLPRPKLPAAHNANLPRRGAV